MVGQVPVKALFRAKDPVECRFSKRRDHQRSVCKAAACAEQFHEDRWSMEEAGWDSKMICTLWLVRCSKLSCKF